MKYLYLVIIPILLFFTQKLIGQELMPQGVFLQTCSPVFGEKYIFEGTGFSYYSDELGFYGKGFYILKRNRLTLLFSEEIQLPYHNLTYQKGTSGDCRILFINLYSPGEFKNNVGVIIELFGAESQLAARTETPVIDSYSFEGPQLPYLGEIKIMHPTEGEILVPFYFGENRTAKLNVWFKNNWEAVPANTRKRYNVENIRASSFLMEKTLVRKPYFCVFIRQDQAERMMKQLKLQ